MANATQRTRLKRGVPGRSVSQGAARGTACGAVGVTEAAAFLISDAIPGFGPRGSRSAMTGKTVAEEAPPSDDEDEMEFEKRPEKAPPPGGDGDDVDSDLEEELGMVKFGRGTGEVCVISPDMLEICQKFFLEIILALILCDDTKHARKVSNQPSRGVSQTT